jgi:hypothetical protein
LANPVLLGIRITPAASHLTFIIGQLTCDALWLQENGYGTGYCRKFCINRKELIFLYKIVGSCEIFGNLPRPFLGLYLSIFVDLKKSIR